jgi:hypothetical protein
MLRKRKEYVAPKIEKRDQLKEVAAAGTTVSGELAPKGGCFKKEDDSSLDLGHG